MPYVPSYVYKYCSAMFGKQWRLSMRNKESRVLYAMLERSPYRYEKYIKRKGYCELNIRVPAKMQCMKGGWLSQESIDLFIEYVHQLILDEITLFHTGIKTQIGLKAIDRVALNQYLADRKVRVIRVKPTEAAKMFWQKNIIYDILRKYDITEDDLTYDSIVKHLQRNSPAQVSA